MSQTPETNNEEIWLPVAGFEGCYEVSNCGNVRSSERSFLDKTGRNQYVKPRLKKSQNNIGGYLSAQLWKHNKVKLMLVHVLVAHAFIGPKPHGLDVNHIDGNKKNNHVSNLEYVTRSENNSHACRTGLRGTGEKHKWAKLTNEQVLEIRKINSEQGIGCRVLSRKYGVAKETISSIINRTNWKYI